ncbi:MAG TPA: vitamin K epoxide reductase family protein [Symbiobacteriaceae bacterium]|nr:vitamin K epoxide reductase family protein [Symbiobacteriaceae bacterium]
MQRDRRLLGLVLLLAIAGLAISFYLTNLYLFGGIVPCGASGGCQTVAESQYAWLLGVPIPMWGAVAYTAITGVAVWALAMRRLGEWGRLALFGLALAGLLFSGYLTYLELFVIRAICRWCVASAVIMLGLFVATLPLLGSKEGSAG